MHHARFILAFAAVLLLAVFPLLGQQAGKKYALLAGINDYDHAGLSNLRFAENDVTALETILKQQGFEVVLLTGTAGKSDANRAPTLANIQRHLDSLRQACKRQDTLLVALAGHGVHFDRFDDSFFCPQNANPDENETATLLSLKQLYQKLGTCGAGAKLLLVDACRNNPRLNRSRNFDASVLTPPGGVAALFSCKKGEVAFEHERYRHGVFFHHVLEGLRGKARDDHREVTWDSLQSYVKGQVPRVVKDLIDRDARQTPTGSAVEFEGAVLVRAGAGEPGATVEVGKPFKTGIGLELLPIPAGRFTMGSPKQEVGRFENEDEHEVEITRPFWMAKTEVTRGQFRAFVVAEGYQTRAEKQGAGGAGKVAPKPQYTWRNAGCAQTDEHPVVNVTWEDAQAFCAWLSQKEGRQFALPTEAQWEWCCRARSATRFHGGDDDEGLQRVANIADACLKAQLTKPFGWEHAWDDGHAFTAPVGRYRANAWGLVDMHGNVWEWCEDWHDDDYYRNSPRQDPVNRRVGATRALRGGSWYDPARYARSAYRGRHEPSSLYGDNFGFRVVMVR